MDGKKSIDFAHFGLLVAFVLSMSFFALTGFVSSVQAAPQHQEPIGTAFTYQGQLMESETSANGQYDFQFQLYDAETGGTQIGETLTFTEVAVNDSLFTVELDFGAGAFANELRWLVISVRVSGDDSFTTLTPRQKLSPTLYSFYADSSSWKGLTSIPAGFADNTDNDTKYTAGEGLQLTGNEFSLNLDTSTFQSRVSGTCAEGSSIRVVNADGTVVCEPDDDTIVDVSGLQTRVSGDCEAGSSIRAVNVDGTVVCEPDDGGLSNPVNGLVVTTGNSTGVDISTGDAASLSARNNGSSPTLQVENVGTGPGLDLKSTSGQGILVETPIGTGVDISSTNSIGLNVDVGRSNGIVVLSDSNEFPTVAVRNSGTLAAGVDISTTNGFGLGSLVGDSNAIIAVSNSVQDFPTVFVRNEGESSAVYAYSTKNTGGVFITKSGSNIIEGWQELPSGSFNQRFKVTNQGNVMADGPYSSPAADFAELLPAEEGLEPGDLLKIGDNGKLTLTTASNDSTVAGVHSTRPAFLGGVTNSDEEFTIQLNVQGVESSSPTPLPKSEDFSPLDDPSAVGSMLGPIALLHYANDQAQDQSTTQETRIPMAVVGVVPTKVTDENGPIAPGDLLTSSSTPGHAMKALPVDVGGIEIYRPGTIVGKALEPLPTGVGLISVLVTLQ